MRTKPKTSVSPQEKWTKYNQVNEDYNTTLTLGTDTPY